ncbi:hypothetical protein [Aeromicrobium sp. UC242_57]|uniref:hypothetical protein n=1 Tax=Aeromicrobium sp. UC242_57 TaxID=3374624 RepID=UPI0037B93ACC
MAAVLDAAERHVTPAELDDLKAAAASDEIAWQREYGVAKDVAGLGVERSLLRYVPAPVTIRFDGYLPVLVRVLLAAARTGAPVTVSTRAPLPDGLAADVVVQKHDEWLAHVAQERPARVRLVGSDAAESRDRPRR